MQQPCSGGLSNIQSWPYNEFGSNISAPAKGEIQMLVYTVGMPVGNKDWEFEAYTRLLSEVGIDLSDSPRAPEPGTNRRWLYAWKKRSEAERFVAELRRRTRNAEWFVHEFEVPSENRGPVAPLEIATVPEEDGYVYYLTPESQERVVAAYPGTKLPLSLKVGLDKQQDLLRGMGNDWWMNLSHVLTGRSEDEIDSLGGVRVVVGKDTVAFQRIPTAAAME
jgi:hypothetical protein